MFNVYNIRIKIFSYLFALWVCHLYSITVIDRIVLISLLLLILQTNLKALATEGKVISLGSSIRHSYSNILHSSQTYSKTISIIYSFLVELLALTKLTYYLIREVLKKCNILLEKLSQSPGTRVTLDRKDAESTIQGIYNDVRKELNPKVKDFKFRAYHVKENGAMINVNP